MQDCNEALAHAGVPVDDRPQPRNLVGTRLTADMLRELGWKGGAGFMGRGTHGTTGRTVRVRHGRSYR